MVRFALSRSRGSAPSTLFGAAYDAELSSARMDSESNGSGPPLQGVRSAYEVFSSEELAEDGIGSCSDGEGWEVERRRAGAWLEGGRLNLCGKLQRGFEFGRLETDPEEGKFEVEEFVNWRDLAPHFETLRRKVSRSLSPSAQWLRDVMVRSFERVPLSQMLDCETRGAKLGPFANQLCAETAAALDRLAQNAGPALSPSLRVALLRAYLQKRGRRKQTVRYRNRQQIALKRERVKGKFVAARPEDEKEGRTTNSKGDTALVCKWRH